MLPSKPSDYERTVYYPRATVVESLTELPEPPKRADQRADLARRHYVRALICVALAAAVLILFAMGTLNGLGVGGRFAVSFMFVLLCVSGVHFGIQSARAARSEPSLGSMPPGNRDAQQP